MKRSILYILFFYLCVLGMQESGSLYIDYEFFNADTVPFFLCFMVTSWLIKKTGTFNGVNSFDISWIDVLCKLSILISVVIIILTLPYQGRDAKLEAVSANIILYYLSFVNTAFIIIILSSMYQPYQKEYTEKTASLIIFAILFAIFMSYSRSLAFFLVISFFTSEIKINLSKKKIFLFIAPFLVMVLIMPLLQGRTDDYIFAMVRTFQNLYFYNAFPFYLGETILRISEQFQGLSLGYPGYIVTKLFGFPLDSNVFFDQKMLYDFVILGTSLIYGDINANVMYPTWAIVSIDFGNMAFLVYLLTTLIIIALLYNKLTIIGCWLYFRFYILGFMVSPVILRDTMFEFAIVILLQFFFYKKRFVFN